MDINGCSCSTFCVFRFLLCFGLNSIQLYFFVVFVSRNRISFFSFFACSLFPFNAVESTVDCGHRVWCRCLFIFSSLQPNNRSFWWKSQSYFFQRSNKFYFGYSLTWPFLFLSSNRLCMISLPIWVDAFVITYTDGHIRM